MGQLADLILEAFRCACSERNIAAAEQLLRVAEATVTKSGPSEAEMERIVEAHEELWKLRQQK